MTLINKLQLSLLIALGLAYSSVQIAANILTLGLLQQHDDEEIEEEMVE